MVGNELSSDESPDSEGDEASDDEIHDLALAVETSGLSPQGHEVTSQPHDDDQGAAIRIVTDAVELGGPSGPSGPAHRPSRRASRSGSAGPARLAEHFRKTWIPRTGAARRRRVVAITCRPPRPCGLAAPAAGTSHPRQVHWSPGNWPPTRVVRPCPPGRSGIESPSRRGLLSVIEPVPREALINPEFMPQVVFFHDHPE